MYSQAILASLLLVVISISDASSIVRNHKIGARDGPVNANKPRAGGEYDITPACAVAFMQFQTQCGEPVSPFDSIAPTQDESFRKIAQLDLQEACRPQQQWIQCAKDAFSSCFATDDPTMSGFKHTIVSVESIVNYVCEEKLAVINRHKACLLKVNDNAGRNEFIPKIVTSVQRSCGELLGNLNPEALCSSHNLQSCVTGVVTEQCGNEIASVLDGIAARLRVASGCPASHLRSVVHSKRTGFSSYGQQYKFLKSLF